MPVPMQWLHEKIFSITLARPHIKTHEYDRTFFTDLHLIEQFLQT